jgi:ribosomal protein S18 acetylase RimI-like enzyme
MEVRPFTAADRPAAEAAIARLQDDLREHDPSLVQGAGMAAAYLDYLLASCATKQGQLLLAVEAGELAGLVCVWIERDVEPLEGTINDFAYVSDLVTLPAFRRRGVGAVLLAAAEAHGRAHGVTHLDLTVLAANEGARRLYEKLGFQTRRLMMRKPITEA